MSRQTDVELFARNVAQLVEQAKTTELYEWRPSREVAEFADRSKPLPKPERRVWRTAEPGLLEQLRRGPGRRRAIRRPEGHLGYDFGLGYQSYVVDAMPLIEDMAPTPGSSGGGGGSRSKPTSRPPSGMLLAEMLLELQRQIGRCRDDVRFAAGLDSVPVMSPGAMVRELMDLVVRRDGEGAWLVSDVQVRAMTRASRSWCASARIALAYDAPVVQLRSRHCLDCGGRLLVRSDASSDVWCGGVPGRFVEGPVREGESWPRRDRGCGATWPRLSWLDLLEQEQVPKEATA